MSDVLVIQSHKGPYSVLFDDSLLSDPSRLLEGDPHFLIDANVARLYATELAAILRRPNTIVIEAVEENKSLEGSVPVFRRLVANSIRRDQTLVAIGGGIIQDLTCFIASTLLRGLEWLFVPTTLLAQADSCIGSKSSINLGETKNILGTFNPPRKIFVSTRFLNTLEEKDLRSGVGEIVKVHAIDGAGSFDALAADLDGILSDDMVLQKYVRAALAIKQRYIEQDEFDRGIRNIFNYGHSFGHAIESATHYAVPHGIAVALGMDIANAIAVRRDLLPAAHRDRMRGALRKVYADGAEVVVSPDSVMSALLKDKKNTKAALGLIFPIGTEARIEKVMVPPDEAFAEQLRAAMAEVLA